MVNVNNHEPNYVRLNQLEHEKSSIDSSNCSKDKPRDLVKNYFTGLSHEEIASSKSRDALRQKIGRIRKNKVGKRSKAKNIVEIEIPENQRYTIV